MTKTQKPAQGRARRHLDLKTVLQRPVCTARELHQTREIPLGLNGIYEAMKRGEIECITIGKKKMIITAPLRRKLGLESAT